METDGGDWTVIQRRGQFGNSIYYFFRNWTDYATGFGDVKKEYWIGNHALHALTSGGEQMSLRVVLKRSSWESVSIDYGRIKIASEENSFRISVGDFKGTDGWDALKEVNGQPFSTFDKQNGNKYHCAKIYHGAWWFGTPCSDSDLNGVNLNGKHFHAANGIRWNEKGLKEGEYGIFYSYPSALMMIRPTRGLRDRRR